MQEAEISRQALKKYFVKGQLISKLLFCVFNFLQKTNKNKSYIVVKLNSFFGGNISLKKSFRFFLTFSKSILGTCFEKNIESNCNIWAACRLKHRTSSSLKWPAGLKCFMIVDFVLAFTLQSDLFTPIWPLEPNLAFSLHIGHWTQIWPL